MASFSFRLQPVLNIKLQTEDNLKNELGKAIQQLELEKRKLSDLENELGGLIEDFNRKTKKTTVRKLIEVKEYLSLLDSKIKQQKENVNLAMLNVDKIREELLKAVKERKILEKLREKKFEEYQLEQKKLEQKTNDEIVSYNHKESN
ncbi:MAG TPA: flagellar export protein FliJ [Clostridia bacterium]|nr:flagellar export protein FliJ [Clostridia bacterium]